MDKDGLISPHWYRVEKLKPKLHSHIETHRHDYRGLIWYLLEDTTTGRNHRFNPAAYQFIGQLDGKRTVQEIHAQISEQLEDFAPGQKEILQLLGQLHAADLIKTDALINTEELFERNIQHKKSQLTQRFSNPVAQKVALWDPEEFLNRHFNKVRWIFSFPMALVWTLLVIYTLIQASLHWPAISQHFALNALSPYNLLLTFLLYPPIKILHELGHAFSAKLEGGEVHEMGVNFLMFIPVPYVNVSTATHFRNKYKRMLVSAAGILVESFLAALGLLLFLASEPGVVQNIGFNIFMIGGISSLFFNGNPLLKYDGYYILADALSIPNLYSRSAQFWRYLFQKYLFGLKQVSSPVNAPGESFWFVSYSISSTLYRLAVLWFIFVVVTEKFFVLGVLLASWLVGLQVMMPLYKGIRFILGSPSLQKQRSRAILSSVFVSGLLVLVTGVIPMPSYTLAQGVVWQPDEAQLKAQQDGFAVDLNVHNNQQVEAGTTVLQLQDPLLQAQLKIAQAKVNELQNEYRAKRINNRVEAGITREALRVAESEYQHVLEKTRSMSVTAFKGGQILLPEAEDLPGRFVRQGDLLGYILDDSPPTIRMAVSQDNIGQLRQSIVDIQVRFASHPHLNYSAQISRESPEATHRLPSAALGTAGGGNFIVDPEARDQLQTLEKIFLVDLNYDAQQQAIPLGTRVYVRINHGGEPLATQWYRRIRQVFLRQFNV